MKMLNCTDLGNANCNVIFKAETVDEVVKQASEHAKAAHGANITPEVIEKMKGMAKDEPVAAPEAQPVAQPEAAQPAAPAQPSAENKEPPKA